MTRIYCDFCGNALKANFREHWRQVEHVPVGGTIRRLVVSIKVSQPETKPDPDICLDCLRKIVEKSYE